MHRTLTRILAATMLTTGIGFATVALAQGNTSATPPQSAPAQMPGQGVMGGQGMSNDRNMMGNNGNMGGMMDMMNTMTRMANTCNTMMESASHAPATPGSPSPGASHG